MVGGVGFDTDIEVEVARSFERAAVVGRDYSSWLTGWTDPGATCEDQCTPKQESASEFESLVKAGGDVDVSRETKNLVGTSCFLKTFC